jgi:hypothetical protein
MVKRGADGVSGSSNDEFHTYLMLSTLVCTMQLCNSTYVCVVSVLKRIGDERERELGFLNGFPHLRDGTMMGLITWSDL